MADVSPEGKVITKILVEDLKTKKSHLLNMTVKAQKDGPLRMDVTTSVGIHLFSLVTTDEGVEYILVRQKKYYRGENSEMAMKPILNMPLDPNHLRNLIFQMPIADKDWSCTDQEGVLRDCLNMRRRIKVMWKKDKSDRPLIDIRYSRRARVQINVRDVSEFDGDPEKTFKLKVPKSFKKVRIL